MKHPLKRIARFLERTAAGSSAGRVMIRRVLQARGPECWGDLLLGRFVAGDAGAAYGLGAREKRELVAAFGRIAGSVQSGTSPLVHAALAEALLSLPRETRGDVVECGAWKGASTAALSLVCRATGRRLKVCDSFQGLRDMWLRGVCVLSDAERAVRDLKEFIEDNLERRIQDYQKDAPIVRDRVAFRHRLDGRDLFLFTRTGFRRACGAANTGEVCRYLADKGLLHMNSDPRYQSRFSPVQDIMIGDDGNGRVFSKGSKVSFYAVEAKILNFEFEAQQPAPAAQPPEQTPPMKDGRRAW